MFVSLIFENFDWFCIKKSYNYDVKFRKFILEQNYHSKVLFLIIRLIKEDETFRIYYSSENSKEYHEYEPQFLEVGEEFVPAIRDMILRYPDFIRVEDLPIDSEDNKVNRKLYKSFQSSIIIQESLWHFN